MSIEAQAMEDIFYVASKTLRITVDGLSVILRVAGASAKTAAASIAAHLKSSSTKEMGEVSLRAMIKRKEPFDMVAMNPADAVKFQTLAKQTGLLYSVQADKPDYDGMQVDGLTTVLFRQQDAPLVKSMMERLHIGTLFETSTQGFQDIIPEQAQAQGVPTNTEPMANWMPDTAYSNENIPNMESTRDAMQREMRQNLSNQPEVSSQQLLDRHNSRSHQDSGGSDSETEQKKDKEKPLAEKSAKTQKNNPQQSLMDTQRQLEQQLRTQLKKPIRKNRSIDL